MGQLSISKGIAVPARPLQKVTHSLGPSARREIAKDSGMLRDEKTRAAAESGSREQSQDPGSTP